MYPPTVYSQEFEEELKTKALGALHTCDAFLNCGNMNLNKMLEKPIQCSVVWMLLISPWSTSYIHGVCGQTVEQRTGWNEESLHHNGVNMYC